MLKCFRGLGVSEMLGRDVGASGDGGVYASSSGSGELLPCPFSREAGIRGLCAKALVPGNLKNKLNRSDRCLKT